MIKLFLLGGFQVRRDNHPSGHFESQKVRALLAYLALHPRRVASRDRLAALLWPDSEPDKARRNLRQAVYNLRQGLEVEGDHQIIEASHQTISLASSDHCWVDVSQFLELLERGRPASHAVHGRSHAESPSGVDASTLAGAAQLYRGDFLDGFFAKESPELDDWIAAQRVMLRERMLETLVELTALHSARGEIGLAIRFARRLVEIEPLSEESHRSLMELYSASGRRNRALAQYDDLVQILDEELGISPMRETVSLYEDLLNESQSLSEIEAEIQPLPPQSSAYPFVPFVGRTVEREALEESWTKVRHGGLRIAMVEGPSGVGRSRLVRTVLNDLAPAPSRVLQGAGRPDEPPRSFEPLAAALYGVLEEEPLTGHAEPDLLHPLAVSQLARHIGNPRTVLPTEPVDDGGSESLAELVEQLLRGLSGSPKNRSPGIEVAVFLDDVTWADPALFRLLTRFLSTLADLPIWLVLSRTDHVPPGKELLALLTHAQAEGRLDQIPVSPLAPSAIAEIAAGIVGPESELWLTEYLVRHSDGLPLAVAELINDLTGQSILLPGPSDRWLVVPSRSDHDEQAKRTLDEVLLSRVSRLPTSARHLISLASVFGHSFDAEHLREAAREHAGVVEICLEVLIEQRFVRQLGRRWTLTPRERDSVLWLRGARDGVFEFAQVDQRRTIYDEIGASYRRRLHLEIAETFERAYASRRDRFAEELAWHFCAAGAWQRALSYLMRCAEKTWSGSQDTVRWYLDRSLEVIERFETASAGNGETLQLDAFRAKVQDMKTALAKRQDIRPVDGALDSSRS